MLYNNFETKTVNGFAASDDTVLVSQVGFSLSRGLLSCPYGYSHTEKVEQSWHYCIQWWMIRTHAVTNTLHSSLQSKDCDSNLLGNLTSMIHFSQPCSLFKTKCTVILTPFIINILLCFPTLGLESKIGCWSVFIELASGTGKYADWPKKSHIISCLSVFGFVLTVALFMLLEVYAVSHLMSKHAFYTSITLMFGQELGSIINFNTSF